MTTPEVWDNKDLFHSFPETQDDKRWEIIKEKMNRFAPPEDVPGMVFFRRDIIPVSKPIRKSGKDNSTLNGTRSANPDRDNLNTIEGKGLNVTCHPIKTLITSPLPIKDDQEPKEEDLFGGYGRCAEFDRLGIKFTVADRYYIEGNFSTIQPDSEDVTDDAGISDNGNVSSKPPTKKCYVNLSLKKIEKHGWKEHELRLWYGSINHSLSIEQVNSYIKDALRRKTAATRIDWKDEGYVKKKAKEQGIKCIPLNCDGAQDGNKQRLIRKMESMMKKYIETHETQHFCLHDTIVSNHEDYNLAQEKMIEYINEYIELVNTFVDHLRVFKTPPMKATYRCTEAKGVDEIIGEIVEL